MLALDAIADEFEPWRDVERCWQSNRAAGLQAIKSRRRARAQLGTQPWLGTRASSTTRRRSPRKLEGALSDARVLTNFGVPCGSQHPSWEKLSSRLAPDPFNLHYTALNIESLLPVVRALVLARRDGAEAAIEWAWSTADPCGGQPLRIQFDGRTLIDFMRSVSAPPMKAAIPPWMPC